MTQFEVGRDYTIRLWMGDEEVYANYRILAVDLPLLKAEGPAGPTTIDIEGEDFISAEPLHLNPDWNSEVEGVLDKLGFGEG
jgi:hypothetical protein